MSKEYSRLINRVTYGVIFVIIIMILILTVRFYKHDFSSDITDWGAIGDFFGGILNPIISIISLILLAKVSIIVAKIGSNQNKKLFIYEQRNKIYQEYIHHYLNIMSESRNLFDIVDSSIQDAKHYNKNIIIILYEEKSKITDIKKNITKSILHFFIFQEKYGHYYANYNFNSKYYLDLMFQLEEMFESFKLIYKDILEKNPSFNANERMSHYNTRMLKINELKDEFTEYLASEIRN